MDLSSFLFHDVKKLQFLSNLHCLLCFIFHEPNILPFPGLFLLYAQEKHMTLNALGLGGLLLYLSPYVLRTWCQKSPFTFARCVPCLTKPHTFSVCPVLTWRMFQVQSVDTSQGIVRVENGNILASLQICHAVSSTFIPTPFLSHAASPDLTWCGLAL